ncbi:unnamed protein product [Ixodes persulcatus]
MSGVRARGTGEPRILSEHRCMASANCSPVRLPFCFVSHRFLQQRRASQASACGSPVLRKTPLTSGPVTRPSMSVSNVTNSWSNLAFSAALTTHEAGFSGRAVLTLCRATSRAPTDDGVLGRRRVPRVGRPDCLDLGMSSAGSTLGMGQLSSALYTSIEALTTMNSSSSNAPSWSTSLRSQICKLQTSRVIAKQLTGFTLLPGSFPAMGPSELNISTYLECARGIARQAEVSQVRTCTMHGGGVGTPSCAVDGGLPLCTSATSFSATKKPRLSRKPLPPASAKSQICGRNDKGRPDRLRNAAASKAPT